MESDLTDNFDIASYHKNTFYLPGLIVSESDPALLTKFATHLQVTEEFAAALLRSAVLAEELESKYGYFIR